ncbi:SMI1/KNR4 family protein [Streptomyces sp. NBC_00083]|uniref:SMI1/KNR4 family protein n=1 Tax=Streptomyces sp. NBC_00083 TaxID=2975647 RepID=UPI00225137C7|nr:SMI1/KNR4 family protein [Streptomyces sp. NBC_00083]MCX5384133.1 SMI1/KNR4 family protein [Streptomyces sp. NBC_00083]
MEITSGEDAGRRFAWRALLQRWSDEWLDPVLHEQERAEPFPDEMRAARWLGGEGATPEVLRALEQRLGTVLPPSYRQFLLTSDGWLSTTHDIDRLLPAEEVGWTRDLDPELVDLWTEGRDDPSFDVSDDDYFRYGEGQDPALLRPAYLRHTLTISHTPDATDVYLLNPRVVTADGEWEAWHLAHWLPGAVRHQSFWALMNAEYATFRGDE